MDVLPEILHRNLVAKILQKAYLQQPNPQLKAHSFTSYLPTPFRTLKW